MINFIQQIKGSIYGVDFYKDLVGKDASFTIYYVLKLWALLSLLTAIFAIAFFSMFENSVYKHFNVNNFSDLVTSYVTANFPNELIITYDGDKINTNTNEPVFFPLPKEIFAKLSSENNKDLRENILVLSSGESINQDSLNKYNAYAVISSTTIAYEDSKDVGVKLARVEDIKKEFEKEDMPTNLVIDKNFALEKTEQATKFLSIFLKFLYPLMFVIVFVCMFMYFILAGFLSALFYAFVAFLMGKFTNKNLTKNLTYGSWYLRALHADTMYVLLSSTVGWVIPFTFIPFLGLILAMGVLYINKNFE